MSDSIRLKLYGYYKCSSSSSISNASFSTTSSASPADTPRPSFFDPVGRAKYDAWVECNEECGGDVHVAMLKYVEVASSQNQTKVGRRCGEIYKEALMGIGRLEKDVGGVLNAGDVVADQAEVNVSNNKQPAPKQHATSSNSIESSRNLPSWIQQVLPAPLIPRGQLDISFADLFFAMFQCIHHSIYVLFLGGGAVHRGMSYVLPSFFMALVNICFASFHPRQRAERFERGIANVWLEMERVSNKSGSSDGDSTQVVVGLSVRSLLDLYLSVRSYPAGSEVVIVPAISIQGMIDVMKYHDLTLVPVDLPSANDVTNNTDTDLYESTRWGVDMNGVKAAMSTKTVAILVVHPFGTLIADQKTMLRLRLLADEHNLDIWEDSAQCYTGKAMASVDNQLGYTGSEYADVSFFSFGSIKTATALGGGLALLRSPYPCNQTPTQQMQSKSSRAGEVACSMRRIQETIYKQQTNYSYSARVLKSFVFHLVSHSHIGCGAVKLLLDSVGLDYDEFVVSSLRGFPSTSSKEFITHLRKRPCPALLGLLHRRLLSSDKTATSVFARSNRCHSFEKLVRDDGRVVIPKDTNGTSMNGWLFPIQVKDPHGTSRALLKMGFDVPCGMTQLKPVNEEKTQCPRTISVFEHILYLPITIPNITTTDRLMLLKALEAVTNGENSSKSNKNLAKTRKSRRPYVNSAVFLSLGVLEWAFSIVGVFRSHSLSTVFSLIVQLLPWIVVGVGSLAIVLFALSRFMSSIYLRSSNTFSKYSDMVFKSPFETEIVNDGASTDKDTSFLQSTSVLDLDSIKVPQLAGDTSEKISNNLQMALLTGATGFIGSLLLRDLLMHRQQLLISDGVAVIVRSKRGKSAQERIDRLLTQPMFDFLSAKEKVTLVHVIDGDVTLPDCGMNEDQMKTFCGLNVSHVFHCAAAVSFSQTLEEAAVSNITSSLQMQLLAKKLRNKRTKFVYISTAFVHGGNTGTKSKPLPEGLFSMHPYDPLELYKSMLGTQSYASSAMKELRFPNTYTFSKCICEHLLLADITTETVIIRPSIVGPSVQEPYEGWAGEKPSTIVAAACLYLKFPYNMWCFGKEAVPFVPVDIVCRFAISKSFSCSDVCLYGNDEASFYEGGEDEKKDHSPCYRHEKTNLQKTIMTVAWNTASPASSSFSWVDYAFTITHLGSVCGHVNRVVAYAGLLLSTKIFPWYKFSLSTFHLFHSILVRAPIDGILDLCDRLNIKTRFARDLKALSPILDLPMLFFSFANQNFYFESDITAPAEFNGERYMFSCAVAAHRFIRVIERQRGSRSGQACTTNLREYSRLSHKQDSTSLVVAGADHTKPLSDLWWALTQPKGNVFIRFAGWVLAKVFRHTAMCIEVDVASFAELARALTSPKSLRPHVIVAPTHRSLYDFLIVSYIFFSLPEMGIDLPYIAAASDFESIPVIGWLASKAGAFFLTRGGTKVDSSLNDALDKITKNKSVAIEVFIEGKRSRCRTFSTPKTGFLRCAAETNEDFVILPITINYEGLPDEASLLEEASSGHCQTMTLPKLFNWFARAFSGKIKIGRVYISASDSLPMLNLANQSIRQFGHGIQSRHQTRVMVSDFHITAASLALDLPEDVFIEALSELGVLRWPIMAYQSEQLPAPNALDMQWAAMLHFGHVFAPFISSSHPNWSRWLSPSALCNKDTQNQAVSRIVAKLVQFFEASERAVDEVIQQIQLQGFQYPDEKHIAQYFPDRSMIPTFLLNIAIQMKMSALGDVVELNATRRGFSGQTQRSLTGVKPLFHSEVRENPEAEAFGAWGYRDSYFVLNVSSKGSKDVTMKGSRYSISGKRLPRLAPFVEEELNVKINPSDLTFPTCENLILPVPDLTKEDVSKLLVVLGSDGKRLSTKTTDRARHGTGHTQEDMFDLRSGNASIRHPDVVVWPRDESELQDLVSLASSNDWCLIPFGGGTNVTHSTRCPERWIDPRPMISVDMKLMSRVLWINEEDGLAHVEAGITGLQLVQHMAKLGFTIGHEPDSYEFSTLGGWIATKASGMKQNKYGNIEDIVKEVTVIGGNGTIMSQKHAMDKVSFGRVSSGVDLKSLMLGSEGCFGIIASAVIKIWPIAESTLHESVLLSDFDAGVRFIKDVSKLRIMKPASVRLLDNDQFRLGQALKEEPSRYEAICTFASKQIGYYSGKLSESSVVCATIMFEGSHAEVQLQKHALREIASSHGGVLAGSRVGKAGYDLTFAIAYLRDFALNYGILGESFETFVPWSRLRRVVEATKRKIYNEHKQRALPGVPFVCCRVTQLYDEGVCVYFYFCMTIVGVPEPSRVFAEIETCARQEILNNGGSLSHHHGVGKLRSSFVDQVHSQGYIKSIVAVKKALDPNNVFGARNGAFSQLNDDAT